MRILTFLICLLAVSGLAQPVFPPATQSEVNSGTLTSKFVSPATLAGYSGSSGGATNAARSVQTNSAYVVGTALTNLNFLRSDYITWLATNSGGNVSLQPIGPIPVASGSKVVWDTFDGPGQTAATMNTRVLPGGLSYIVQGVNSNNYLMTNGGLRMPRGLEAAPNAVYLSISNTSGKAWNHYGMKFRMTNDTAYANDIYRGPAILVLTNAATFSGPVVHSGYYAPYVYVESSVNGTKIINADVGYVTNSAEIEYSLTIIDDNILLRWGDRVFMGIDPDLSVYGRNLVPTWELNDTGTNQYQTEMTELWAGYADSATESLFKGGLQWGTNFALNSVSAGNLFISTNGNFSAQRTTNTATFTGNVVGSGTNILSGSTRFPAITTNTVLFLEGNSNVVGLGIGANLSISGGNLTASGGAASTNNALQAFDIGLIGTATVTNWITSPLFANKYIAPCYVSSGDAVIGGTNQVWLLEVGSATNLAVSVAAAPLQTNGTIYYLIVTNGASTITWNGTTDIKWIDAPTHGSTTMPACQNGTYVLAFMRQTASLYHAWTVAGPNLNLAVGSAHMVSVTNSTTGTVTHQVTNFTGSGAIVLSNSPTITSPIFLGNPTASTPSPGDADTTLATTEFVNTSQINSNATFYARQNGNAGLTNVSTQANFNAPNISSNWNQTMLVHYTNYPAITVSNFILNFRTNSMELNVYTNINLTNIVGHTQITKADLTVMLRPLNQNATAVWPAAGANHNSYNWRTNANNTLWTTLTNNKVYILSISALGSNLFPTLTLWE